MLVYFFVIGLILGSFFNVLILRIPKGQSLITPGSRCPSCGHTLAARELIPVVSYLYLGGRCARCEAQISIQYPLVELITGLGFAFLYYWSTDLQDFLVIGVFFSLLLVLSVIDLKHKLLPNVLTLWGIILGLGFSLLGWTIPLADSLLGLIVGGGVLLILALITKGGMGIGDVKLLAMIGTYLGPFLTLVALFWGALFGSVIGVVYLLLTRQSRKTPIPFGPFLAAGALLVYLTGGLVYPLFS